jgi:hypothetical protein
VTLMLVALLGAGKIAQVRRLDPLLMLVGMYVLLWVGRWLAALRLR